MIRRQHEHAFFRRHHLHGQPGRGHRRPQQRHVGAVVQQPGGRMSQVIHRQVDVNGRVSGGEGRQDATAGQPAGRRAQPHHQPPGHDPGRMKRRRHPAIQRRQGLPRGIQERRTRRRQHHAPAGPREQRRPDRVLEPPDLRRQDLLGDVRAPGRGGEAGLLGHRDEIPQVPQFNVHREPNPRTRPDRPGQPARKARTT
jgi:hypothetical protein